MSAEVWAIGGGKGGTGKSFLVSSLGLELAQQGKNVTLLDADLGGANLHSFIRLKRPRYSLTDFFENRLPLEEIIEDTQIPNLRLATGDIHSLNPQGIKYTQKLRFFRHIRNLETDYILIDLGAGSGVNIVDSFLLADKMVVVIVPEITAIENLYQFLKKVLYRKIDTILRKHRLHSTAMAAWNNRKSREIQSIGELIQYLKVISPDVRDIIDEELGKFRVYLILNQVRNQEQVDMGFSVKSVIIKYFGIEAVYTGYVSYKELFWKFINQIQPITKTSDSIADSREIGAIVRNVQEISQVSVSQDLNG